MPTPAFSLPGRAFWRKTWAKLLAGCLLLIALCCCLLLGAGFALRNSFSPTVTPTAPPWPSPGPELAFSPKTLLTAQAGNPYKVEITVTNNVTPVFNMQIVEGEIPPGMTFTFSEETRSATLKGVPTQPGEYTFVVTASCYGTMVSGQTGKIAYRLAVK